MTFKIYLVNFCKKSIIIKNWRLAMDKDENPKGAVIIDVDGVINNFSNKRFYYFFAYHALHELAKIKGRKKLLMNLPKLKKLGGPNALFRFIRFYCGDDYTFNKYCHRIAMKLNYNLIKNNPSMKEFMTRLNSFSDIIVRSDGLSEIACAVWLRVVENYPSAKIKEDMLIHKANFCERINLSDKKIKFSGIVENNFKIKSDGLDGWVDFFIKNNIKPEKSVLIDDSRSNCRIAQSLGMQSIHISIMDSFFNNLSHNVYNESLSDVLGQKFSQALKNLDISWGEKVDIKELFSKIKENSYKNAPKKNKHIKSFYKFIIGNIFNK